MTAVSKRDRVPALLRLVFWSGEACNEEGNKTILVGVSSVEKVKHQTSSYNKVSVRIGKYKALC